MRKIEQQMKSAVLSKQNWQSGNTAVFFISAVESGNPHGARSEVHLHGNHIGSFWHDDSAFHVNMRTFAEYPTNTTLSRLIALGVNASIKNGKPFIDGVEV